MRERKPGLQLRTSLHVSRAHACVYCALQRTPNEILDYFNIKKDATWEEEQDLINTHKWIDPEGLIAKDREKRLAEKAKETSA